MDLTTYVHHSFNYSGLLLSVRCNHQQRGSPLRKYFTPGYVLGRGLDLDLRIRPAPQAAASGDLGFCPLGIEVEKHGFRTAWLITGQKFQGVGLKSKAFVLTFREPSSY